MELFMSKLMSSILEIVVVCLIPFVVWLITARKKESFVSWVGLKKVEKAKLPSIVKMVTIVEVAFIILSIYLLYVTKGVEGSATGDFAGVGIKALPAILVYAILNTSFPEEVFFRGFLLKRLSGKFGFGVANYVQCILFGFLHGAMFIKVVGTVNGVLITCFTMAIAWFMGYVNEKKADGSILPSWCIHAIANVFSGLVVALSLI